MAPLLNIGTSPTNTPNVKTVVAEGVNIQITNDIVYEGTGRVLVLVAKKNTNSLGGNIYIAPNVRRIDAILIADGSVQNGIGGVAKNWIDNPSDVTNRLVINGRLYGINTRGGSLVSTSGTLTQAGITQGKYFDSSAGLQTTTTSIAIAAGQDLERFRVIPEDGNTQCTLHINYQSIPTGSLPQILTKPAGYGGACGF